ELAKEWHPTKNGSLTPSDVTQGSHKKVWWQCKKDKTHEWATIISIRNKGVGCPYCSNRMVNHQNCLATTNPELAKEWHPTKNGSLTPNDVTQASNKKVWWQCKKDKSHEWAANISNRNKGSGCPYCSNKAVNHQNCLATTNPGLAKEWHPTKNGTLSPKDITPGSDKKVWWQCKKDKTHEWRAAVYKRSKGRGCPYCSGRAVNK
ncbi:MAG: zinc-ribbon domain-containing protein, partial [bacterium]|nr:zinc-ribbon domain-containing protein [bacterium]